MASHTSVTVSFLWLTARRYIAYEIYWKKFYARTKEDRTNFYAVLNKRASAAVFFMQSRSPSVDVDYRSSSPEKSHSIRYVCVCLFASLSFSRGYIRDPALHRSRV